MSARSMVILGAGAAKLSPQALAELKRASDTTPENLADWICGYRPNMVSRADKLLLVAAFQRIYARDDAAVFVHLKLRLWMLTSQPWALDRAREGDRQRNTVASALREAVKDTRWIGGAAAGVEAIAAELDSPDSAEGRPTRRNRQWAMSLLKGLGLKDREQRLLLRITGPEVQPRTIAHR